MSFNVITVCTISIIVSLVLIVMIPILNSKFVLRCIGGKIIILFFLLLCVRVLIPVQFEFSTVVLCQNVIPFIRDALLNPLELFGFSISKWKILLLVWLVVAAILFVEKTVEYCRIKKIVGSLPPVKNEAILSTWSTICCEHRSLINVQLVETDAPISPFVIGVIKPIIVFPTYSFTQEECMYILKHEALHCIHKDTITKWLIDILCTFYWWNPLFYVLKKKVFDIIEIVNDSRLTKYATYDTKVAYLNCLASTVEKISKGETAFVLPFTKSNYRELKKRVDLICESNNNKSIVKWILTAILFCSLIFTISIRLEPYSLPSGDNECFILRPDSSYIIQSEENVYEVYYKGKKLETVDDITNYPGIKVYDKR